MAVSVSDAVQAGDVLILIDEDEVADGAPDGAPDEKD